MRRLLVLPIVHSRSDLGSLQTVASQAKVAALGEMGAKAAMRSVDEFWSSLAEALLSLNLEYDRVLIYQDGLPQVPNVALQIERQIVDDLARGGSPNHILVKRMLDQGAGLVGTESPELLLREYHTVRRNLTQGYPPEDKPSNSDEPSLLEQRDRFIAQRINDTLGQDQVGLLFIGMLHQVENYLPDDFQIEYPVGRPPASAKKFIDSNAASLAATDSIHT